MGFYDEAYQYWLKTVSKGQEDFLRNVNSGALNLSHYKGFLLETFHNTQFNPQLQGYATLFMNGNPHKFVKKFFQHAISEIGHDQLALNDLKALGVPEAFVNNTKPLPVTKAFFANTLVNIQRHGVIAYLAYLFHLEASPVTNGEKLMEALAKQGIPASAMQFIEEHAKVDLAHLELVRSYLAEFINSQSEKDLFLSLLSENATLHSLVTMSALKNGEELFQGRPSQQFAG